MTLEWDIRIASMYFNEGIEGSEGSESSLQIALSLYDKVLPEVYFKRGFVLEKLGKLEAALTSYDKAIELDSNDAEIHSNKGFVLGKLGRYDDALTSYDKAIELEPNNVEIKTVKEGLLARLNA